MKFLTNEESFLPKSIVYLRDYNLRKFTSDLIAWFTVGLVALPLTMAFAISSGVLPQSRIYCAINAGFLISALGGSKTQIGRPTGAFVVVVSGIVAKYGLDGLFMRTLMAGKVFRIHGPFLFGVTDKLTLIEEQSAGLSAATDRGRSIAAARTA
jgi:SulP family sulfate permease